MEANNKYIKYYEKTESLYITYWDVQLIYGWVVSQKLPIVCFKWIENTSQFNENFMENYNEDCDQEHSPEVDLQYLSQ